MDVVSRNRMMLFTGGANLPLAEEVADILGVRIGQLHRSTFANGEIYDRPIESVRGADCFVIQSHSAPINENIMEHFIIIDALRRASARRITAVMPFYGYSRQDKKVLPREPITARMIGDFFVTAGADRIVSVDLHSGQLQGFVPSFDHLTALPIITDYLRERISGPTAIISPDAGGVKRAEKYARRLDGTVAFVYKRREPDTHNVSAAHELAGDVKGRHAIIVDDMVDTAGTVTNAADLVRDQGALSVRIAATHAIFSEPAIDRIKNSSVEEVIVTNTLPVPDDALRLDKIKVLSIASILAEAVHAIFTESSVSEIFLGDNT
ncbi:MAG TPA: ribose-phosphate diphosphokinase [Acidimicrobiia bacterium]|nr:ribose-phosphate diphosphokinase [Acidimicrobiia bacterium]HJU51437.1 ribose-phosphate diphosphokinase [Acidimicrobiia bacterium]HJU52584.1 ribose-phosphate diphosphokinase [Acidimicrobiia bacterium]HKZ19205.1 ribose-phosphate diphosphokinase [Acidimicrobiia bacterium]